MPSTRPCAKYPQRAEYPSRRDRRAPSPLGAVIGARQGVGIARCSSRIFGQKHAPRARVASRGAPGGSVVRNRCWEVGGRGGFRALASTAT